MENKSNKNEPVIEALRQVLSAGNKDLRSMLYKDIILNALKCQQDELDILDLKVINRVVAEFRHAACVFRPYRDKRKVSIFGSARTTRTNPCYQMAVDFGRAAVQKGFMVITGAAGGIMTAGIEGAGPANSFGVNILLPHEAGVSKVIQDDPKVVKFKYFFTRKLFFVMETDAVALFPGGFGTHDEGFEVLTLLQTGKAPPMPVVLLDLPGEHYWEAWDQFVQKELLARHYIATEDLSFYRICHSPAEAADWIKDYYETYHSVRQVRSRLVIRLEKELPDVQVRELNRQFKDLLLYGRIGKTAALADESDEPDLLTKPRLAFVYNRKSAGRLNQMILEINRMGRKV